VWYAHNTVFGLKRAAICVQAGYFLHSMMPSVMCLRLSDASVLSAVLLFTVSNSGLLLFYVSQTGGTAAYSVYPISDIGRHRKFEEVSYT